MHLHGPARHPSAAACRRHTPACLLHAPCTRLHIPTRTGAPSSPRGVRLHARTPALACAELDACMRLHGPARHPNAAACRRHTPACRLHTPCTRLHIPTRTGAPPCMHLHATHTHSHFHRCHPACRPLDEARRRCHATPSTLLPASCAPAIAVVAREAAEGMRRPRRCGWPQATAPLRSRWSDAASVERWGVICAWRHNSHRVPLPRGAGAPPCTRGHAQSPQTHTKLRDGRRSSRLGGVPPRVARSGKARRAQTGHVRCQGGSRGAERAACGRWRI